MIPFAFHTRYKLHSWKARVSKVVSRHNCMRSIPITPLNTRMSTLRNASVIQLLVEIDFIDLNDIRSYTYTVVCVQKGSFDGVQLLCPVADRDWYEFDVKGPNDDEIDQTALKGWQPLEAKILALGKDFRLFYDELHRCALKADVLSDLLKQV